MAWGRRAYVVFSRNLKPNLFCKDRNLTLQSGTSFQKRKEDRGHLQYEESKRRERKKNKTEHNQAQLTEEMREETGHSQTTGYCSF